MRRAYEWAYSGNNTPQMRRYTVNERHQCVVVRYITPHTILTLAGPDAGIHHDRFSEFTLERTNGAGGRWDFTRPEDLWDRVEIAEGDVFRAVPKEDD